VNFLAVVPLVFFVLMCVNGSLIFADRSLATYRAVLALLFGVAFMVTLPLFFHLKGVS